MVFNFPEKSDQTRFGDLEPEVKDPADLWNTHDKMLDVRTSIVPLWPTNDSQNQFIYYISGGYILIYFLILFIASVSRRKEVGLNSYNARLGD